MIWKGKKKGDENLDKKAFLYIKKKKKNRLILFKGIPLFSLRYFKKKIGVSLV
jgi:hypothetical protein